MRAVYSFNEHMIRSFFTSHICSLPSHSTRAQALLWLLPALHPVCGHTGKSKACPAHIACTVYGVECKIILVLEMELMVSIYLIIHLYLVIIDLHRDVKQYSTNPHSLHSIWTQITAQATITLLLLSYPKEHDFVPSWNYCIVTKQSDLANVNNRRCCFSCVVLVRWIFISSWLRSSLNIH